MSLPPAMKALQLRAPGRLERVEMPLPRPAPDELLVRTGATTICTSDLSDIAENPFGIALPRVLGHEGAGVVADVGGRVRGFIVGQRVTAHPVVPCGRCDECVRSLGHLCTRMGHLGLDRDGTFAEYFCIRADRARLVPRGMDLATAALMEPVAVCLESVRRARAAAGEGILVAGDGPFGVITARLLLRDATRKVILVGHHDFRMQHVPEAIGIHAKRTDDVCRAILGAGGGVGPEVAILCVASQAALDVCLACLRPRGRLVVFSPMTGRPRVDLFRLMVKELEILGACNDEDYLDEALEQLAAAPLNLQRLVTHRIPFEQWERAIELASRGKATALKVALVFGEER